MADKDKLSRNEELLYDSIRNALSIGGGAVGLVGGPGGALLGAGLGAGAGKGIKEFAKSMQGIPTDNFAAFKEIPIGAVEEAAGGVLGKGLSKLVTIKPPIAGPSEKEMLEGVLSTLKKDKFGNPIIEYHGSRNLVRNPRTNDIRGVLGEAFFTTTDKPTAQVFSQIRSLEEGGTPVINEFFTKDVPEFKVSMENLDELGKILGLSKKEIDQVIHNTVRSPHRGDNVNAGLYTEALLQKLRQSVGDIAASGKNLRDVGRDASEALKKAGYRKLSKEMDIGKMEIANWHPQEDLLAKEYVDKLQQKIVSDKINSEVGSPLAQKLMELLGKTIVRNKGEK